MLTLRITKVDQAKREVWGRAVEEVVDKSNEIFDYKTSAPLFRAWSAEFEKSTSAAGQEPSLGNVREMHSKSAVGKLIALDCKDDELAIDVGAQIIDDAAWEKVEAGVYTGFSIGGSYLKKWKDGDAVRYTAQPSELSLVDNPCVPTARFAVVKADGTVEDREFTSVEKTDPAEGDEVGTAPAAPAEGEAASGAQTPAEGEGSAEAAPAADPAASATPEGSAAASTEAVLPTDVTTTQTVADPAKAAPAPLAKSLGSVATLAALLQSIAWLAQDAEAEKGWEGDDSKVPELLRGWLKTGVAILKTMSAEETAELVASVTPPADVAVVELSAGDELGKAGARHSKADKDRLQAIHDHAVGMGADCGAAKADASGELAKVGGSAPAAVLAKLAEQSRAVDALTVERDRLAKRVAELEAEPVAPKGVVRAPTVIVSKAADNAASDSTTSTTEPIDDPVAKAATATDAIKLIHAGGGTPLRKQ